MRRPALPRMSSAKPEDFRDYQERRRLRAEVSDYCGAVLFRNFKRLMFAISLLAFTIANIVSAVDGHGVILLQLFR